MKKLSDFEIIKKKPIDKEEFEERYWVKRTKNKKILKMFKYEYQANCYINQKCMKPCPYCKTKDIGIGNIYHTAGHSEGYNRWEFFCSKCNAIVFTAPASNFYSDEEMTKQEAITKYNTRRKK